MAITNEKSSQMAKLTASPKQTLSLPEYGGKLRIVRFDHTQGPAAGDVGSTADLIPLPAGARVLGLWSWAKYSGFGAGRDVSIGTRAHRTPPGNSIAEDLGRFFDMVDVSSNGYTVFALSGGEGRPITTDFTDTLLGEAVVFATIFGGTWQAGAKLVGEIAYLVD